MNSGGPDPDRPGLTGLFDLRIADEVERLKQEPTWHARAHNAITLTKEGPLHRHTLESGVEHEVEARQESAFLLAVVHGT